MRAFVYRNGEIGIAPKLPDMSTALPLARAPAKMLKTAIEGCARLSYQNTWLCPGVPEADDDMEAVDAVLAFKKQVQKRIDYQKRNVGGRAKARA